MKLYVPNPQTWVDFFQRVSSGKTTLNQSGSGRRPHVIPVIQSKPDEDKQYTIKAVLPAEQTTAQAKSELKRQNIKPGEIVNMVQSDSGRKRKRKLQDKSDGHAKRRRNTKGNTKIKVIRRKDIFDEQ